MSLVDLSTARLHLRADPNDTTEDSLITIWLAVAEQQCVEFLNRFVYLDSSALSAAQSGAQTALDAAATAHTAALTAAQSVVDDGERALMQERAHADYEDAKRAFTMTVYGMVVNESIRAAILLQMAYLFETRQPEADMPDSHRCLLMPYRVGMGV